MAERDSSADWNSTDAELLIVAQEKQRDSVSAGAPMPAHEEASEQVALDLHDLYENAPCGYHSVGPDGTILRMNQTGLTWLGFSQRELVGRRKFAELVDPPFHSEYERAIATLIAGREIAEIEMALVRKDGSMFDAFLRIAAVRDSQGRFLYTRATLIDITTRKRAEAEARIHAEQLRAVSQRVVEIQETERRDLSAELHDRLGQDLAAINLNLHIIKDQLPAELLTRVGPRLDDSIALVERTVEVVRDVAGALRPLVLDDYGLAVTLKSYGEQFAARTGIRVIVEAKHTVPRLQQEVETALFRISQEALANVLKHAQAAMVRVTLASDAKSVSLTITDDGCGFDAGSRTDHRTNGLGLLIMHERLRPVEGSLRIQSRPGAGTTVIATVRRVQ
ncbi:PAS domain S-box protein [Paraburkholderia sp. MPAMCS5]|uniref:PAS domain-containing sensor histidine kinase n=1 Tax=Paraburkholderia sp. MPAMCS5 TaxID=3112563 RepID=UPI002E1945FE|nr:PAS domain S-box protein [Paraburkholderia sp. MPAMCS5]